MDQPFIGSIVLFAGNFAPRAWALCNGQLLAISSNSALFSILGTTYGGDGRTTFGLPDLRSRVPVHPGRGPGLSTYTLGERGGAETVTLNTLQIPQHTHLASVTSSPTQSHIKLSKDAGVRSEPATGDVSAKASFGSGLSATPVNAYGPETNTVDGQIIPPGDIIVTNGLTGGSQGHLNIQPFLGVNYIIALQGLYPSRS